MLAGMFWGVVACLAEIVMYMAAGQARFSVSMIPGIVALYALYWSAVGGVLQLASRVDTLKFLSPRGMVPALLAGVTLHAILVRSVFPEIVPPASTFLWVACYGLAIPFGIFLQRRLPRFPGAGPTVAVVGIAAVFCASALFPARDNVKASGTVESRAGTESSALPASGTAGARSSATRPNVLILMIDTLRKDHVGTYGYPRNVTPNLDRFAKNAWTFDAAYSTSSWTHPAVVSLFTSQYPSTHGVETKISVLSDGFETLAETFAAHAYRTGIFTASLFIPSRFGFGQGFEREVAVGTPAFKEMLLITEYFGRTVGKIPLRGTGGTALIESFEELFRPTLRFEWWTASRLHGEFRDWIRSIETEPFFAYLHVLEPHSPYEGQGLHASPGARDVKYAGNLLYPFDTATAAPLDTLKLRIDSYDDEILVLDREVGRLFRWLGEQGLLENTIVVVIADHGEEFYDHRGWKHGITLFDELVATPLVVRAPGRGAGRHAGYVSMIDIAPTLLDLAGLPVPEAYAGRSFAPVLDGDSGFETRTEIFAEIARAPGLEAQMLLSDDHKLIQYWKESQDAVELYDLRNDPGETRALAQSDSATAAALRSRLRRILEEARAGRGDVEEVELDPVLEKRLRAMGYVN